MKKYLTEGIGAFFLTLAVVMTSPESNGYLSALVAGAMLLAMYSAGAPVSGAHYNPAVSLAMLIRGKLDRVDFTYYWVAQFAGSGAGALLASFLLRCSGNGDIIARNIDISCALIAEFLGAFALVFTVLQVTLARDAASQGNAGMAIGFVFFAGMAILSPVSGGYFNPALALGAGIVGIAAWSDFLIYLISSLLGAVAAISVFRILNEDLP